MGIFGWSKPKSTSGPDHSVTGFDTWRDPVVSPASADWERRLNAFARKSALALQHAEVPLFRSQWSRDGHGTYADAFWLVAADVDYADRCWVKFSPGEPKRQSPNHPPPARTGEHLGRFRGTALLLTKSGIVCGSKFEGFLTRAGQVDGRCMDVMFESPQREQWMISGQDGWGWNNKGRWRRDPKSDLKVYGVDAHINSIRFEGRFYRTKETDPGFGTSAAISNFVKTNGQTRWPRGFISFSWD